MVFQRVQVLVLVLVLDLAATTAGLAWAKSPKALVSI